MLQSDETDCVVLVLSAEDEQFNEERNILLTTLEALDDSILKQDGKTAESAAAPSTASAAAPSTPAPSAPASK